MIIRDCSEYHDCTLVRVFIGARGWICTNLSLVDESASLPTLPAHFDSWDRLRLS